MNPREISQLMTNKTSNQKDEKDECPISFEVIRHPVKVFPSEKIYELKILLEWFEKSKINGYLCPQTQTPIDSFQYETEFKKQLDKRYQNNDDLRCEDYNPNFFLKELEELIHPNNDERQSINKAKSILLGSGSFLILTILNILKKNTDPSYFSDALLAIALGCLDYNMREITAYGLPGQLLRFFDQVKSWVPSEVEPRQENINQPQYP